MLKLLALFSRSAWSRLFLFRSEVVTLWRAFRHRETPLHLKAAMVLVVFYLINPFDFIPEVVPFLGVVDDFVIVPLLVGWIVKRLPAHITAKPVSATIRQR
jgi:uncharacterized membrane protein YkvA (DUF1232 family)